MIERTPTKGHELGGALVAHQLVGVEKLQCGQDAQ